MSSSSATFSSVPILDYSLLSSPATRPQFILELQHALINVGFLYLSNHPVAQSSISSLTSFIPQLFALPQDAKDAIKMRNSPHFLGYSQFGAELTRGEVDQREQFDFGTPMYECQWRVGMPAEQEHLRLWGPSQWPKEDQIPGFRETFESYLIQVQELSYEFSRLIAEALGLGREGLSKFYDVPERMQHRAKIVKYPVVQEGGSDQGVGAHYDAGFLTFLLQASDHRGLQVQNLAGEWIDAPPIPGTFVVNIGKALEFVTRGLARATSHRVLSPKSTPANNTRGSTAGTPRYSVPFFQNIGLNVRLPDEVLEFLPEILKLRDERGTVAATDSINFTEFDREPSGKVNLIGRVKSHPDVAEQHYPELFKQIFPDGYKGKGSAY